MSAQLSSAAHTGHCSSTHCSATPLGKLKARDDRHRTDRRGENEFPADSRVAQQSLRGDCPRDDEHAASYGTIRDPQTARDFSCCILTADDEMLAMAESLPIHVMSGPDLIARYMKQTHPTLRAGDAFLHNSPYHGNSHAADWCVSSPSSTATASITTPSSRRPTWRIAATQSRRRTSPTQRDVYNEGALIFPCVKVQEDYRDRDDVLRMARVRIRVPDLWHGDYLALSGARPGSANAASSNSTDELGQRIAQGPTSETGSTTANNE